MKKESLIEQYKKMAEESARNMSDCVLEYLEKEAEKDPAFKEKYIATKFNDCIKFINDCAQDIVKGSGEIPDNVVYKMARDFFNDCLWEEEDPEVKEAVEAQMKMPERAEKPKKERKPREKKPEPVKEEPVKEEEPKPEPVKKPTPVSFDAEQLNLFGFGV